jgi:hypothetical protein
MKEAARSGKRDSLRCAKTIWRAYHSVRTIADICGRQRTVWPCLKTVHIFQQKMLENHNQLVQAARPLWEK